MTIDELSTFLENNPQIEWAYDDEGIIYLRHSQFDGQNDKLRIEPSALAELTPQKLEQVLVGGRNVDHITRITGYFSKVSGWNKGKKGELEDRQRVAVS
ncbi:MAG: anaerobic ribonucleoside-triphosphate reductase [Candidatus Margulisiibacteriota bacterium]